MTLRLFFIGVISGGVGALLGNVAADIWLKPDCQKPKAPERPAMLAAVLDHPLPYKAVVCQRGAREPWRCVYYMGARS